MKSIKIPRWVEEQLSEGETVISKISYGRADYYATDKRLLRFRGKSDCDVLEYDKMSITFRKYGLGWKVFRIIAVLFGLLAISLGILSFVGPTIRTGTTVIHMKGPFEISLLLWFMGLLIILAVLNGRYGYYQVEYPGFGKKDLKGWRIMRNRWGAGKVDRFADVVKERQDRSQPGALA